MARLPMRKSPYPISTTIVSSNVPEEVGDGENFSQIGRKESRISY